MPWNAQREHGIRPKAKAHKLIAYKPDGALLWDLRLEQEFKTVRSYLSETAYVVLVLLCFSAGICFGAHPEYLIKNWSAGEGVPENSALAVAQTPDGYLWVGSRGGLLRFNGHEFQRVSRTAGLKELDTTVQGLSVDRSGRLWVSTTSGLAMMHQGIWKLLTSSSVPIRNIVEDQQGNVLIGGAEGKLLQMRGDQFLAVTNIPDLSPSGVFLLPDAKHNCIWVANRKIIGHWADIGVGKRGSAIVAVGPQPNPGVPLLAASARGGGLWVYANGHLTRYKPSGTVESWNAPVVDQPRDLLEDSSGNLWLASMTVGLVRWRPDQQPIFINATNGLSHGVARSLYEDAERNLWVGTSSSGLFRLRKRFFVNVATREGLGDRIAKSVTELEPGVMVVGTHGGGRVRIAGGRAAWESLSRNESTAYCWTLMHDRSGRLWSGTFNQGLWVMEAGVERQVSLPTELGTSVGALLEDSRGRIWVGASMGLGIIEAGEARVWATEENFKRVNVRSIVEDPSGKCLWVGTFGAGCWRVDLQTPGKATQVLGLPRKRITALAMDRARYLWVGVFGEGLFCVKGGQTYAVGRSQGFPANTVGSILEDGLGALWLGTDQGIVRVEQDQLHAVVEGKQPVAMFNLFNDSDGMDTRECSEGFQSTAARDSAGELWFTTLQGVVRVNPRSVRLNSRPPPIVIESVSYADRTGGKHVEVDPLRGLLRLAPGSTGIEFQYAALSYSAPEKNLYTQRLVDMPGQEVRAVGNRVAAFQSLPPGRHTLLVKAANNDGMWNDSGAQVTFEVLPFFWQTGVFRGVSALGLVAGIGLGGWRFARARYRGQIERLEQQHALERERARLSAVMEATTDLVVFADADGNVLHVNPAGRELLGIHHNAPVNPLKLQELFTTFPSQQLANDAQSGRGTWQGETELRRADGRLVPVSQVLIAHRDSDGRPVFLSTIARDISAQKQAIEERERLQVQLAQAQKLESVGRLAGGVAHDFNNSLQVILGNLELALQDAPQNSDLESDLLEIKRSAQRAAGLTQQLLAFGRKQMAQPKVLDINVEISRLLPVLREAVSPHSLSFSPGHELWPVSIDPAQLERIILNLTLNAHEALEDAGTVSIKSENVRVRVGGAELCSECPPGNYVLLSVVDNGRGMSPEVVKHLFEPFFTTKALGQGTGLGLATVFGMVKQNSGFIHVQSEVGQGSTFRILIPAIFPGPA